MDIKTSKSDPRCKRHPMALLKSSATSQIKQTVPEQAREPNDTRRTPEYSRTVEQPPKQQNHQREESTTPAGLDRREINKAHCSRQIVEPPPTSTHQQETTSPQRQESITRYVQWTASEPSATEASNEKENKPRTGIHSTPIPRLLRLDMRCRKR